MKRRLRRYGIIQAVALLSLTASGLVVSSAGAAVGAPSAVRAVRATGIATSISVRWVRPVSVGATPIRDYVVTSSPLAKSCTTRTTTCVVKGLTPGKSYTFHVVAKNANGASGAATSNRVAVASASTYLRTQIAVLGVTTSVADTALNDAQSAAQQQKALQELTESFDLFIASLSLEHWPSNTRSDMAIFVSDTRQLANDTVTSFAASTANAAADFDVLQGVTNKVLVSEANVFTDLGFPSLIIAPITTAPTAVPLGTAQTVHDYFNDPLTVTATQLYDPATAATGSGLPDAGFRFVAVELTIDNQGSSSVNGDANYSVTVTGSDGQAYSPDYGTVSECTNFNYGEFALPASDSATGCVLFELPTSVTVQSVQFNLAPSYLDTAEWTS